VFDKVLYSTELTTARNEKKLLISRLKKRPLGKPKCSNDEEDVERREGADCIYLVQGRSTFNYYNVH